MYLYECRRWDEEECEHWRGALIIAANNKQDAIECFASYGDVWDDEEPTKVIDMGVTLFKTSGDAYVVYDDYLR